MKHLALIGALVVAGCGEPGPSVPVQRGHDLYSAQKAITYCAPYGPGGARGAMVGGYTSSVILGGVILGPLVVVANQDSIRAHGEAGAVDRCLEKRGFTRRNLTREERFALNRADPNQRIQMLNHMVGGGDLKSFTPR